MANPEDKDEIDRIYVAGEEDVAAVGSGTSGVGEGGQYHERTGPPKKSAGDFI